MLWTSFTLSSMDSFTSVNKYTTLHWSGVQNKLSSYVRTSIQDGPISMRTFYLHTYTSQIQLHSYVHATTYVHLN